MELRVGGLGLFPAPMDIDIQIMLAKAFKYI